MFGRRKPQPRVPVFTGDPEWDEAKRGAEKLTEAELRAVRKYARADALWPSLLQWHRLSHPFELMRLSCRDMDDMPDVMGIPTMRDDFGRVWPKPYHHPSADGWASVRDADNSA